MQTVNVAIAGATGAVGEALLEILAERDFPVGELALLASERSAGKRIDTPYGEYEIELFSVQRAQQMDFVFLAVSGGFAKQYAPQIAERAVVIDNSSAFRYERDIPLIVPEINPAAARDAHLIANPNCTTAILVMAVAPLHRAFGVKRAIVSTYQAASGAGAAGMDELLQESRNYLQGHRVGHDTFSHPLAFNVIPHIDTFQENGYTREEMKVVWETHKILDAPDMALSCTAVRIPTLRAHAEAVTIETQEPVTPAAARAVLHESTGIDVVDNPGKLEYPMPLNATKQYNVQVGRIRQNLVFGEHGLDFFVCGDQLLKGAALNAVQIGELLA